MFPIHIIYDLSVSFGHMAHCHGFVHSHALSNVEIVSYQLIIHLLLVSVIALSTNHFSEDRSGSRL